MIGDIVNDGRNEGVLAAFLGTDVGQVRVVILGKDGYFLSTLTDIKPGALPPPEKPKTLFKKKKKKATKKR